MRAAELIASGKIGRVTSITSYAARAKGCGTTIPQWLAYTYDRASGAGALEIAGGHTLDAVRYLVGPVTVRPAGTAIANPAHTIAETGEVVTTTTPDQIVLIGASAEGATVSVSIHDGVAGSSRARIEIQGTGGELAIETLPTDAPLGAQLQITPLRLRGIDLPAPALPEEAVNVAALYRQFADDLTTGSRVVPDFRAAIEVHRLLDDLIHVGGQRRTLLRVGAQRLRRLGAVAVDRERLDAEVPRLQVGVGDVLDRRLLGHIHRLRQRSRDERLHRAHHLDVAHV